MYNQIIYVVTNILYTVLIFSPLLTIPTALILSIILIFKQSWRNTLKKKILMILSLIFFYLSISLYFGIGELSFKQNAPITEVLIIPAILLSSMVYIIFYKSKKNLLLHLIPISVFVSFKILYYNSFFHNIYILSFTFFIYTILLLIYPYFKFKKLNL